MESRQKACNNRIQDVSNEQGGALTPITLLHTPLLSAQDALQPLLSLLPDLDTYFFACAFEIDNMAALHSGLTRDEAIAVRIYTMEWQDKKQSLYYLLNDSLRTASRETIKPFFLYLKLLLTGLSKLPPHQSSSMTLWRGVTSDISKQYAIGKKYFWWGFSSCTTDLQVLNTFLGAGPRVVFSIHFQSHCVDIKALSCFANESEVLLLPGRCFEVLNNSTISQDGLTIIQLKEVATPPMIKGVSLQDSLISKPVTAVALSLPPVVVDGGLKDWFGGLGFSGNLEVEYCEMFVGKGFDSLDIIELIDEVEFEKHFSGIPPGHKLKIWRAIQKLQSKSSNSKEERGEKERLEKERLEQERIEKERIERLEMEKIERFKKEIKEKEENIERLKKEIQEKERLENERLDKERLERIENERLERLEKERLEKERLENERLEKERLEKERLEKERLQNERAKENLPQEKDTVQTTKKDLKGVNELDLMMLENMNFNDIDRNIELLSIYKDFDQVVGILFNEKQQKDNLQERKLETVYKVEEQVTKDIQETDPVQRKKDLILKKEVSEVDLLMLENMGFKNWEKNIELLAKHKNFEKVLSLLINE